MLENERYDEIAKKAPQFQPKPLLKMTVNSYFGQIEKV